MIRIHKHKSNKILYCVFFTKKNLKTLKVHIVGFKDFFRETFKNPDFRLTVTSDHTQHGSADLL